MNQRRDAREVGRIDHVPRGLEVLNDSLDVDGVPEGDDVEHEAESAELFLLAFTRARHTLTEAEKGRTVKVRVTFTDDAGYRETGTSAATKAVAPLLRPLTATLVGVPTQHDGRRQFSFELRFSEDFPGRFAYPTPHCANPARVPGAAALNRGGDVR